MLNVIMLIVIMLNVIMLSVIMLNVIMHSVVKLVRILLFIIVLNVIMHRVVIVIGVMLSVILLIVLAPKNDLNGRQRSRKKSFLLDFIHFCNFFFCRKKMELTIFFCLEMQKIWRKKKIRSNVGFFGGATTIL